MSNIVYKFFCLRGASTSYIGMTTCHLGTRIQEHRLYSKNTNLLFVIILSYTIVKENI